MQSITLSRRVYTVYRQTARAVFENKGQSDYLKSVEFQWLAQKSQLSVVSTKVDYQWCVQKSRLSVVT